MVQVRSFFTVLIILVSTNLFSSEIPKPEFDKVCELQKIQAVQLSNVAGVGALGWTCNEIADHPSTWPKLAEILRDPRYFAAVVATTIVIARWEDISHMGREIFNSSNFEDVKNSLGDLLGKRVPVQKIRFDGAIERGDPDEIDRAARALRAAASRKKAKAMANGYIRISRGQSFTRENSEDSSSAPRGRLVSADEMETIVKESAGGILKAAVQPEKEAFDRAVKWGNKAAIKEADRALRIAAAGKRLADVADDYITHTHF